MPKKWLALLAQKEILLGRVIRWNDDAGSHLGAIEAIGSIWDGEGLKLISLNVETTDGSRKALTMLPIEGSLVESVGDCITITSAGKCCTTRFSAKVVLPPQFRYQPEA